MSHDQLCPAPCENSSASCDYCDPAHERCQCACELIARVRYQLSSRHLTSLPKKSWDCGDCGNTYTDDVKMCPNKLLDKVYIELNQARHAQ